MHFGLFLIPLLSAFIGWFSIKFAIYLIFRPIERITFLGFRIQGYFPAHQDTIAEKLGQTIGENFAASLNMEQKMADPAHLEKLLPIIEEHIDHFLKEKLPKQMPVVSMFIGEKTIHELKTLFLNELKDLFPVIMKHYAGNLGSGKEISVMIKEKIKQISPENLERVLMQTLLPAINKASLLAAILGLCIGFIQVLIAWLL